MKQIEIKVVLVLSHIHSKRFFFANKYEIDMIDGTKQIQEGLFSVLVC